LRDKEKEGKGRNKREGRDKREGREREGIKGRKE
jgi:hypothetical protein